MGKYIRKSRMGCGEEVAAVMDLSSSQSSLGVLTRAKTLALKRLQKSDSSPAATATDPGNYLQLRSRRLAKKPPIIIRKRQKDTYPAPKNPNPNDKNSTSFDVSRVGAGRRNSGSGSKEDLRFELEASFGENALDGERTTRESTPCSLIREPDTIGTPSSTTKPVNTTDANRNLRRSSRRSIPTTHEMDEFFSGAEEEQQKQFIEKYNFDPAKEKPLPGRYEWQKVKP